MAIAKKVTKVTKAPAVMVETKKLSAKDTCDTSMSCCTRVKHWLVLALFIINTILLVWILSNQTNLEAQRIGGRANYNMVQKIYKSPAFKEQQKQQIEQALDMYKDWWATQQQTMPTLPITDQTEMQAEIIE